MKEREVAIWIKAKTKSTQCSLFILKSYNQPSSSQLQEFTSWEQGLRSESDSSFSVKMRQAAGDSAEIP